MSFTEQASTLDATELALGGAITLGFVGGLFVLSRIVPGKELQGAELADGSRLTYRLNGLNIFLVLLAGLGLAQLAGLRPLAALHEHFVSTWIGANVLSIVMSLWLWRSGLAKKDAKRGSGPLGWLSELWYGVELNPALWGVDIKMFSYRPSLMGLFALNASFAAVQYEQLGTLTTAMMLYQAFTFVYVLNYFQFEHGMLFTWDIVAERFGFMLVWGDYAFVPFCYSVVGWYLVDQPDVLPAWAGVALTCSFLLGLWIFRGANQQKDEFKRDPKKAIWGKTPETLGGRILVSGFWGIGRKLNYTGEILVYWSFSLLAGFDSFVPFLLPTWLLCLLIHRAWRDEQRCRQKYGALWDAYCQRARFRMIPFVY